MIAIYHCARTGWASVRHRTSGLTDRCFLTSGPLQNVYNLRVRRGRNGGPADAASNCLCRHVLRRGGARFPSPVNPPTCRAPAYIRFAGACADRHRYRRLRPVRFNFKMNKQTLIYRRPGAAKSASPGGSGSSNGLARILICCFGSLGDLHPYLAFGVELRERGHQVIIRHQPGLPATRGGRVPGVPPGSPRRNAGRQGNARPDIRPSTRQREGDPLHERSGAREL